MGPTSATWRFRDGVLALLLGICLVLLSYPAMAQSQGGGLLWPSAIAYDAAGNLFVADSGRHQVFEATLAGSLVVVAGTGVQGFAGDGSAAKAAQLNQPQGVAVGPDGTLYIADTGNARVRAVANGIISTVAGTGQHGFGGDGDPIASASFRSPAAMAVDAKGRVLVCDPLDQRIRRLDLAVGGLAGTIAGTGVQGFSGDGGAATAASLDLPTGVAASSDGRVFFADSHNQRVRVISAAGVITTFAGNGTRGSTGDGAAATAAQLTEPRGLALGVDGTLWIGDAGNRRVRQVDTGGIITTLAGSGLEGTGVDGDALTSTNLRTPRALTVSSFGSPVVADFLNGTVRVFISNGTAFQPAALAVGRAASAVHTAPTATQVYGPWSAPVSVSGPVGTPQGAVVLAESGSDLASATLKAGAATLAGGMPSAGTHTMQVSYGGDGLNFAASSNIALTVTPLSITALANDVSVVYGTAIPTLTGSVQGVLAPDVGQVAAAFSVAVAALPPVGIYPISVALKGVKSSNYTVSLAASSGSLHVTPAPTVTSLPPTVAGYAGLPFRLTANVASTTQGQPGGTVRFLDGGILVGTGTLVNGSASYVETAAASGTHSLTAVYSGDGNFLPSTSAVQTAMVNALPDYTLALTGTGSVTVSAGSAATFSLLIASSPAPFTGVVTLAVNGLPQGATATFSPMQVVPGASSAVATLTVLTPAAQAWSPVPQPTIWFGCVGIVGMAGLWRRWRAGSALALLSVCLLLTGCGARTVGEGTPGLTSKSYALSVLGTSTNLLGGVVTHSVSVTLVVQQ